MKSLATQLEEWLPPDGSLVFGEICLDRGADGTFQARHVLDEGEDPAVLVLLATPADLREIAKYDVDGEYRPLKTTPGLRRGWRVSVGRSSWLVRFLDAAYPAAFATTMAHLRQDDRIIPLRETLGRQTGMYRRSGEISDEAAAAIRTGFCAPRCLRRIVWPVNPGEESEGVIPASASGALPMICTEACTLVVNEARKRARESHQRAVAPKN